MTKVLLLVTLAALLSVVPRFAQAQETGLFTKTAQQGTVKATLSFAKPPEEQPSRAWQKMQMQITRQGKSFTPTSPDRFNPKDEFSALEKPQVSLVDWEGDQDPEVLLTFFSGGANCCFFTIMYSFDAQRNIYRGFKQDWGKPGFSSDSVKDLDGDGRLEYLTSDQRFGYAFSSGVASYYPVQVLQFRKDTFVDVTRRFPKLVREEAVQAWQEFQRQKKEKPPYADDPANLRSQLATELQTGNSYKGELTRPPLAAYLASKYLLGEGAEGWKQVKAAYKISDREKFFRDLTKFLRKNGFAP